VLGINEPAVTIKNIEKTIVDRAWKRAGSFLRFQRQEQATSCVVVRVLRSCGGSAIGARRTFCNAFRKERSHWRSAPLRIPNFKMEKHLIDRRIAQMAAEGVEFVVMRMWEGCFRQGTAA